MITIFCKTDIDQTTSKFPPVLLRAAEDLFGQLREMLDFDKEGDDFNLEGKGYSISYLEPHESVSSLRSLGVVYPFFQVEYVEFHGMQEPQYFRILLMHDNECFTIVFSLKGTQNTELEEWLWDQAIVREGESE